jgi:hypothetical protein
MDPHLDVITIGIEVTRFSVKILFPILSWRLYGRGWRRSPLCLFVQREKVDRPYAHPLRQNTISNQG